MENYLRITENISGKFWGQNWDVFANSKYFYFFVFQ